MSIHQTLYFTPVAGVHLFAIPTAALWDPGFDHDTALSKVRRQHGRKGDDQRRGGLSCSLCVCLPSCLVMQIENLGLKAGISDGEGGTTTCPA